MYKEIAKKIRQYDSIVIFRHQRPDMDALGSQIGLKHLICQNYKGIRAYAVGDTNKFNFIGEMDVVSDDIIQKSLAIIVDVAVQALVSDNRYQMAKERIVIDHHKNDCDILNAKAYVDTNAAATCQMITQFSIENKLKLTPESATPLYGGIVTDSGRFMFSLNKNLFDTAGVLIQNGANAKWLYQKLYTETLQDKKMKAYFTNKFEVNSVGVAYLMNDKDVFDLFDVDVFSISRGMVGVMSNIEGIEIWANFTYDISTGKVLGEFRSKSVEIVSIAKKHGGGGHSLACGATLKDFDEARQVIEEFSELLRGE